MHVRDILCLYMQQRYGHFMAYAAIFCIIVNDKYLLTYSNSKNSTTSIVPYLAWGMISWVCVMESWAYSVTNRFYCLTFVTSRDRTFTKWKFIWNTMLQPHNLRHVKLHYLLYTSHEDHHIKYFLFSQWGNLCKGNDGEDFFLLSRKLEMERTYEIYHKRMLRGMW